MSRYANNVAQNATQVEEVTGSTMEQALVAAGDVFSGLFSMTPAGIASNVYSGFNISQQADPSRSVFENLTNAGVIAADRFVDPIVRPLVHNPIADNYSWDSYVATYDYLTSLPAYYATNAAVWLQAGADAAGGDFDPDEFYSNLTAAEDIFSATYDEGGIDVGQAMLSNFASVAQIATTPFERISAAISGKPLDEFQSETGRIAREWSLGFMSPDFNLFSSEDRVVFEEGLSRIGSGTLSAASQVALDPLNLIGFGPVAQSVKGLRMLNKASKISQDEALLVRAAQGERTRLARDLDFMARNNAGTIQQHALLRSVSGPQRSQLSYLLGEVDTAEDAAKVFLAVERGSLRAQVELANKYSHLGLSLDGLNAGGYVNRLAIKGQVPLGTIDNAAYLDAVAKHLDTVDADPFVKRLTDLAYREVGGELVSSPQMLRTVRSSKGLIGTADRLAAITRARLIQDGRDGFSFFTKAGEGNPLIQHIVRPAIARTARGVMINAKGVLDVDDTTGMAFDKFAGSLADVDYLTKNEFTRSGLKQQYLDGFRDATTAAERRRILEEADAVGFRLMAEAQGMTKARAADVWKGFKAAKTKYFVARKTRGFAVLPDGSIVRDPILREATEGTVELLDWRLVNQALREDAGGLKGVALRGIGKTGRGAYTSLSAINNFFIAAILFRPARVARERLQGTLGVIGSGHWKDMWFDPDIAHSPKRIIANMATRGGRTIDNVMTKFGKLDDPKLLSELTGETTFALRETDRAIEELQVRVSRLLARKDLDPDDRIILEDVLDELDGELLFHGSPDGLPGTLEDRWLATTEVASDAQAYVDSAFPRTSASVQLGRAIDPVELRASKTQNAWQGRIDSTRARNAKRQAEIVAKQDELTPLSESLASLRALLDEAETRWADADSLLAEADASLAAARASGSAGRKELIAQRAQAQRRLSAAKADAGKAQRSVEAAERRLQAADDYIAARKTAQQADDAKTLSSLNERLGQDFKTLEDAEAFIKATSTGTETFRLSLIDEMQSGATVQRRLNGRWVTESEESIASRSPILIAKQEFRVIPQGKRPQLLPVRAHGQRVDIRVFDDLPPGLADQMGWKSQADVNAFFANTGWRSDQTFYAWMKANRFGKVAVPDASSPSGQAVHVIPDLTDLNRDSALLRRIDQESLAPEVVQPSGRDAIRNTTASVRETGEAAGATRKRITKSDNPNELLAEMRALREQQARLRNEQAAYSRRTAAATARKQRKNKPIKYRGQGRLDVRGTTVDDAFAGAEGEKFADLASARETFDQLVQGSYGASSTLDDIIETTVLDPSDPQYFDGWANVMNGHYRLDDGVTPDPVVKMIAEGADDKTIRVWLTKTPEGKAYADSVGVGRKYTSLDPEVEGWRPSRPYSSDTTVGLEHLSVEDYVDVLRNSVNGHMPTDDLKARFLAGERFDAFALQDEFGPYADMLAKIDGRISIPAERRGFTGQMRRQARNVQRVINEMPQTAMENHPMFVAAYRDILRERWEDSVQSLGRDLTKAEVSDLVRQSRQFALKEVRKWTYSIANSTNATQVARLGIPFITAYTYTLRTIGRALRDNPAEALWFAFNANKAIGQLPWVDAEGNPTDFLNAEMAVIEFSPEMAETLGKIPFIGAALENASSINISRRSMDVFFGGELAPGSGVLVTVPMGEIVRRNPEFAQSEIVKWALPLGAGSDAVDVSFPRWAANEFRKRQGRNSADYAAKLVQVAAVEDAKWRMGLREEQADEDELRQRVNALYDLSSGVNLFSPVSFSATQPAQEARRVYDQYVDYYGKEEADWRFMAEQPELADVFVSTSLNNYRVNPTQEAMANLERYSEVADIASTSGEAGKALLGFLVNGSGRGEYDEAVNTYLRQNSPDVGGKPFIENLSPEEAIRRARARDGWVQWRQFMNGLDAIAIQRNTTVAADRQLAAAKAYAAWALGQDNPEWSEDRRVFDGNQFNQRAVVFQAALENEAWMRDNGDRADIKALAQFLETRSLIKETINQRGPLTGNFTLSSNPDLKAAYHFAVQQLKTQSPQFAEIYNTYFDEDTVT